MRDAAAGILAGAVGFHGLPEDDAGRIEMTKRALAMARDVAKQTTEE